MKQHVMIILAALTAAACVWASDDSTRATDSGTDAGAGNPSAVRCYVCGRTHDEVHDAYLEIVAVELENQREEIRSRHQGRVARYEEDRAAWQEISELAAELPDIVLRMRYTNAKSEMENLRVDYPVLADLDAYPPHGQGPNGDATISDLVEWVDQNPPDEPDFEAYQLSLSRIDEQILAASAYLDSIDLISEGRVNRPTENDRRTNNTFTAIERLADSAGVPRRVALDAYVAMQTLHAQFRNPAFSDDDLATAVEGLQLEPNVAAMIDRSAFERSLRVNLMKLTDDPDEAWLDYQIWFGGYRASAPMCILCAPRL